MKAELVEAIRKKRALFFVGSGVSAHVGLPTWGGLLDKIAVDLDFDPRVFSRQGTFPELAEYYKLQKMSIGPLRAELDRMWHPDLTKVDASAVHQAILKLDPPIIYTTNYDRWLETAYERSGRKFKKIKNVGDLIDLPPDHTQIIKFHGDFDDDDSIVLTERDYFDRLAFDSPLDARLRSDAIGKVILFLGYSLSDINIRLLLYRLDQMWTGTAFAKSKPRSFILLSRPNVVHQAILESRGIIPIVADDDDPGKGMIQFMDQLTAAVAAP